MNLEEARRVELQEKLRLVICDDKLWKGREQDARDYYKVRIIISAPRYIVVAKATREKIFSTVLVEEKDCHLAKVGCDKEPVIAGR